MILFDAGVADMIYKTVARATSSCSNVLAIRVISAGRAPTAEAIDRQVLVAAATSRMIVRALASVRP